jgi:probable rRNA maturation factor
VSGATRGPRVALAVQYGVSRRALPARPTLRRWARAAAGRDVDVTLRFVGRREGRRLNRAFRGRDYATNVLTFVYPGTPTLAGDIAVCAPVVAAEARARAIRRADHLAHLVVHGMLHQQGYDHERRADARRMERRESDILTGLGLPDPWRV